MPADSVYSTDVLPPQARAALRGYRLFESDPGDDELSRCRVLMTWPSRAPRELLTRMPNLEMYQSFSAGVDSVDFSSLPPRARVYSNAGGFTATVAEHAFGLLLGVAKGVHVRDRKLSPRVLGGKTILVLGCGAIGSEIARLCRLLGMKTVGVSRSFRDPDQFDEVLPVSAIADAIPRADAVAIALPLTKKTRGIIDLTLLRACRPDVTLVNVGRGELVDEAGMITWLKERPESRYATDVFWKKDGRENFETAAWELPNFGGTRHDSGVPLGDTLDGPKIEAAKNVKIFLETGRAPNLIDSSEYL